MFQRINQASKMIALIIHRKSWGRWGEAPKPMLLEGKCNSLTNSKFKVKWVKVMFKSNQQWVLAFYHLVFLQVQTAPQETQTQASKWKRLPEVVPWTGHFKSNKLSHKSQAHQPRKEVQVQNQTIHSAQLKLTSKITFQFTNSSIKMGRGLCRRMTRTP